VHDRVTLAAGGTSVEIVPALGGKIASMRLGGREWLWTSDVLPWTTPTEAVAADDAASYVLTADTGGYDECAPTVGACRIPSDVAGFGGVVLPDHGELWSQHATTDRLSDDATGPAAITHWTGRRMPYAFARTVRVAENGAVHLDYALTNRGGYPLPFLWSAHPLLPFTDDTRLHLPTGARMRVWAQHGLDLGGEGAEHQWPLLRVDGRETDFTQPRDVLGPDARWACKLFLDLPATSSERTSVAIEQEGVRLEASFPTRDVPNFGLWLNHRGWTPFEGGTPYLNLAFEPCIGTPDALDAALGVWHGAAWLPPGKTRRWSLEWRAMPAA
jgi:galactose mutarotase-like enzyme